MYRDSKKIQLWSIATDVNPDYIVKINGTTIKYNSKDVVQ